MNITLTGMTLMKVRNRTLFKLALILCTVLSAALLLFTRAVVLFA